MRSDCTSLTRGLGRRCAHREWEYGARKLSHDVDRYQRTTMPTNQPIVPYTIALPNIAIAIIRTQF
jgi:hypothetical protein